ncbi:UNVERIFIED_CONTAM: hypothetical protein DVV45_16245, partial [Lactiplantibacillus plantarum]|nr:hypothetical protein [Lactiplantibacillus plantarum]
ILFVPYCALLCVDGNKKAVIQGSLSLIDDYCVLSIGLAGFEPVLYINADIPMITSVFRLQK